MARRKTKRKKPTSQPVQNFKQKRSQDRIDAAEIERLDNLIAQHERQQEARPYGNSKT